MSINLATAYNKRVSGFGTSCLCPNPRSARTSDTHHPLGDIAVWESDLWVIKIK